MLLSSCTGVLFWTIWIGIMGLLNRNSCLTSGWRHHDVRLTWYLFLLSPSAGILLSYHWEIKLRKLVPVWVNADRLYFHGSMRVLDAHYMHFWYLKIKGPNYAQHLEIIIFFSEYFAILDVHRASAIPLICANFKRWRVADVTRSFSASSQPPPFSVRSGPGSRAIPRGVRFAFVRLTALIRQQGGNLVPIALAVVFSKKPLLILQLLLCICFVYGFVKLEA